MSARFEELDYRPTPIGALSLRRRRRKAGEAEPGEGDLGLGEQARHQELVAELDLVDVDAERGMAPPAEER